MVAHTLMAVHNAVAQPGQAQPTAPEPAVPATMPAEDLVTQLVGRSGVSARWRHRLKKTRILRVREV